MLDLNLFRRKTAMLLHEIEIEIGNLVLENQDLLKRETEVQDQNIVTLTTKDLVEQSYLDGLFQLIVSSS